MTPHAFIAKWSKIQLKEITTAQSHFLDVCQLVGHPAPLDADPVGNWFTFEVVTDKVGGKRGRADVWYKGKFIWEYKGADHDLDKAYEQLLLYRESLGNPPLFGTPSKSYTALVALALVWLADIINQGLACV